MRWTSALKGAACAAFLLSVSSQAYAAASMRISETDGYRYFETDSLPNHGTGSFPNRGNPHAITSHTRTYRVPLKPRKNSEPQPIGLNLFGIALNGVVFDPNTAEFYNNDRNSGWNLDALEGGRNLGLDDSNAHVQPDGTYHYHATPYGFLRTLNDNGAPVLIGYAADGFPIYAPFEAATSSWRVKQGSRPDGPGGAYSGKYNEDWEYIPDSGTLDACNGMTGATEELPNGGYFYVLTKSYPYIPRCLVGTADDSFVRKPKGATNRSGDKMEKPGERPGQRNAQRPGGRPDLNAAAERLGISAAKLRRALGPPPPDFAAAAKKLGVSEEDLRQALHGH